MRKFMHLHPMPTATSEQQHARRSAIAELLGRHRIARQSELVARLRTLGYEATQSSVSRDLRELGVAKQSGRYRLPANVAAGDDRALRSSAEFVRSIAPAGPNLLVLRTAIGAAQRVALTLDRLNWPEIVGTLSGDDTIFIATTTLANQRRVQRRLQDNLEAD
ncbi:MAG TPA: arginine repressor [Gammaproteobacteria bacterium]|nr:arginine repressor [Gammaproteobacteria bacterium]